MRLILSLLCLLIHCCGAQRCQAQDEWLCLDDGGGFSANNLLRDLSIADYWTRYHAYHPPVYYNFLLSGGYFNMPSARVGASGEIGVGYSSVPPYRLWNVRLQLNRNLEVTGNYRIFNGVADPILTPLGFGDMSDKGANIKVALLLPHDSGYKLPGIAVGFEDIIGTKRFNSWYIVATKVWRDYGVEMTLGYGNKRYKGLFGAIQWQPFFRCGEGGWLEPLALSCEYDATDYKNEEAEPHPKGRKYNSRINGGIKYRLCDTFDFSVAYVRGRALAGSFSAYYNFGYTKGLVPKVCSPLPYRSPICREPLDGGHRPPQWLMCDLLWAFRDQGLRLMEATIVDSDAAAKQLRLVVINDTWRLEHTLLQRLSSLLLALTPLDVDEVVVVLDAEGLPLQQYRFRIGCLRRYGREELCDMELALTAPRAEAKGTPCEASFIYRGRLPWWRVALLPRTLTYFGSSKGKFKYAMGLSAEVDGYLWRDVHYDLLLTYIMAEDLHTFKSVDRLNPSQIINVRSDIVRYLQRPGLKIERAYLQKSWNFGNGWFARAAAGLFEIEYGGVAGEFLYYPAASNWAVGAEGAVLRKRTLTGIGFSDKVRQLDGFRQSWRGFLGSQGFLSLYYDWEATSLDFRVRVGKFLANDVGVRYEVSRYFPSGMRITVWYSRTNGRDYINCERYHDKGFAITMPLDIFFTYECRKKWYYSLHAWLRDVGVIGGNGTPLYDLINDPRQW